MPGSAYWHFRQAPSNSIVYLGKLCCVNMSSSHWGAAACDAGVHMAASNVRRKERGGRLRYTRGGVIDLGGKSMQCGS
jgi:hypothetical protein